MFCRAMRTTESNILSTTNLKYIIVLQKQGSTYHSGKKNTPKLEGLSYVENDRNWGLFDYDLPLRTNSAKAKNFDFYGIVKVPQLAMGITLLCMDKTSEIIVTILPKLRIWFGKLISHQ